jgi:tRNA (adenine57-N1/adenine58-N1)-methyltransferase
LHLTTPSLQKESSSDERLEIFEAGTGHGALTLNLSRAIHGANTRPPTASSNDPIHDTTNASAGVQDGVQDAVQDSDLTKLKSSTTIDSDFQNWRDNRRAVVHTLDCLLKHSRNAEKTIKNFRDGVYYNNIDFHVGNINDYISDRLVQSQGAPFLDHAILDLPSCHDYMEITGTALKHNGSLLVFCPNITQINTAVLHCKSKRLPLYLETVLELGAGAGVGGREWDVRPVRPRAFLKARAGKQIEREGDAVMAEDSSELEESKNDESTTVNEGWELICRPKVGMRVQGGGFVAQWRKMSALREDVSERRLKLD